MMITILTANNASAAEVGSVSGIISNIASGNVLQDARVEIPDLKLSTLSDDLGRYSFKELPSGMHTLQVYYTGLTAHYQQIHVIAGEDVEVNVALSSEIYQLEQYVVTGEREGNAAAIARQKAASNIKNVVSLDAFGNLSNDNIGELLIRLPGIIGNLDDEGNIDTISIRGADPGMTVVSVDGNQMASSGGFARTFRAHNISAALFDEIEVAKAPTPDMPGDSMGGSVNLKSGSTLRLKNRRITYRINGRWSPPFYDPVPMASDHPVHALTNVRYQDIFSVFGGKNNLGISLNLVYDENGHGNYKSQLQYEYTTNYPAYIWGYQTNDNYNNRKQASVNLRMDYRPSPSTTLYFTTLYNDATQPAIQRFRAESFNSTSIAVPKDGVTNPDPENPDDWVARTGPIVPGYTDDVTMFRPGLRGYASDGSLFTRFTTSSLYSSFITRERQFNFGAKHEWGRLHLEYDANYSFSHVNMGDGTGSGKGGELTMFVRGNGAIIDKTNSADYPSFSAYGDLVDVYDVSTWDNGRPVAYLTSFEGKKRNTDIVVGRLDARYVLPTQFESALKFGGRYRWQEVETLNGNHMIRYSGTFRDLAELVDPSVRTRTGERTGREFPYIRAATIASLVASGDANWYADEYEDTKEYYLGTRDAEEEVAAGYAQASARFGKLNLLGGVRYEKTTTETFGYYQIPTNDRPSDYDILDAKTKATIDYGNATGADNSYDDLFPSMHATYRFTRNFLLRASWSNTIGRPSLSDLLPGGVSVNTAAAIVSVNNSSLKPQKSENWDLSLEYYFEPIGQITIGAFRKNIDDFFVTSIVGSVGDTQNPDIVRIREEYPFLTSPQYDTMELRTKFNGNSIRVDGVEFSYRQSLQFLPGFLKGLGVFLNYTHLHGNADYGDGGSSTSELQGFTPDSGNAGLTWKYRKFNARVMVNYTGKALTSYNSDWSRLIYRKAMTQVNAAISYQFHRRLTVNLEMTNAFNAKRRFYQYDESRPYQFIDIGTTIFVGLSGTY